MHWVVYDVPANLSALPEGVVSTLLPSGAREGQNDGKTVGYRGPCPPIGRHRYFHKPYALDAVLPDLGRPDKAALEAAMKGHILAQGTLIGTYAKKAVPVERAAASRVRLAFERARASWASLLNSRREVN